MIAHPQFRAPARHTARVTQRVGMTPVSARSKQEDAPVSGMRGRQTTSSKESSPGRQHIHCPSLKPFSEAISRPFSNAVIRPHLRPGLQPVPQLRTLVRRESINQYMIRSCSN
jgi:hypothetical protein